MAELSDMLFLSTGKGEFPTVELFPIGMLLFESLSVDELLW